jgi:hypothetical protein
VALQLGQLRVAHQDEIGGGRLTTGHVHADQPVYLVENFLRYREVPGSILLFERRD